MAELDRIVHRLIELHAAGNPVTLLAVCPNSQAVLEAAVKVAAEDRIPMLFAATLNQVDRDGGYTGWTPREFVGQMRDLAERYRCTVPLFPCLDHGGPWLKDAHTRDQLTLEQTMAEVRASLTACLEAGYTLLHIDPTVDRSLPPGAAPAIDVVVDRTIELIGHCEAERLRLALPPVSYEVGTEEVHGGLADLAVFDRFLTGLRLGLRARHLGHAWPCFVVGKIGTDLHTTTFDAQVAHRLFERVAPLGSLVKGHYTDWVANPGEYPAAGVGAANVGPEFTATELNALKELCRCETDAASRLTHIEPSGFVNALETAVIESERWMKWLLAEEGGRPFRALAPDRQQWLVATGARYVWTDPRVVAARRHLYENLCQRAIDPHAYVLERIAANIRSYTKAFGLHDFASLPVQD